MLKSRDVSMDLWQSVNGSGIIRQVIGPLLLLLVCPVGVQICYLAMHKEELDGSLLYTLSYMYNKNDKVSLMFELFPVPTEKSTIFLVSFFFSQLTLLKLVPGKPFDGPRAPSGHVPKYTDNGFVCFWITIFGLALLVYLKLLNPGFIYENLGPIMTQLNFTALVLCLYLYFKGLYFPSTKDAGSSGNILIDFYWGTELYPSIAGVDLKTMLICRYGMMLWCLFTLSFSLKTAELNGGKLPTSQMVSSSLLFVYLAKFYWWERYYLCAADIQVDRFGFMLCWGTICFMPLVHTLQNLFLVTHHIEFGYSLALFMLFLGNTMTFLNYDSDTQRHRVRAKDGLCNVWGSPAKIIRAKYTTADGKVHSSILSASGYNGIVRHFHYVPDIVNLFLYCSPSGFTHILPYLYFIYLTSLLIDRTNRIDERCAAKYGKYWDMYCKMVPYRLVPGIF